MGNCIKKNRRAVSKSDHVRNNSRKCIRGEKADHVECDEGNTIECQKQSVMEVQNVKTDNVHNKRPLDPPPTSGCQEQIRQKSHPLPTPNLTPAPTHQDNINKTNFLPLPKPETSSKPNESNSDTSVSCILPMPRSESEILSSPYLKAFSFDELRKATSNFCEDSLLGEGGFGCVYKGWLEEDGLTAARPGSGLAVAIKKLIPYGSQGHKEWLSEVNYLGRLHHPNLVKLIGYCLDGEDRILVYEFMPGGSLENHLFRRNSPSLSWARRIKVAVGAARGLCFLHESKSPVIYRDFKTSNILLDSEFNAKLSDFGLAKAGPTESETHVTTRVMGTEGYCDPHYLTTGKLTVKCDVYSFGVVLLELLTGRRAIDETKCQEEKNLVNWVKLHVVDNRKIFRIMDTKLEGQYCKRSAYVAANIALRCVNHEPKYRPPMTYILEILENLPSHKNH
ncbi:Serine/threonine protein kinase [Handroanthus impetiginosus]|uniref:non-specific serine/threonine protein kinase n=1 Tax=Handroanthus impetiginosus TaxID=429701 RepID=A0A2G9HA68_9LAMI|nr:Serine/threonine protein kinase [Handroanthus impetiginosus]